MVATEAEKILKEIEKMAEKQFLPIVGPKKGKILVKILHEIRPKRVLEIGTLIGYSVILMAKELQADAHVLTIEIHPDEAEIAKSQRKESQSPSKCGSGRGRCYRDYSEVERRI
jgi:predicted O-methyltransferase YrrM